MAAGRIRCWNIFMCSFKNPLLASAKYTRSPEWKNVHIPNSLNNVTFRSFVTFQYNLGNVSKQIQLPIIPYVESIRHYAKSRDKKKSDKGHKKKVQINEDVISDVIKVQEMREHMQGAVEKLKEEYIKHLSLRSTSGSIEEIPITYEGKDYILQDIAQVVRKNPKTVVINMVSFPQIIPTVLQAINKSGMNLSPQQDGTTLFIPIPKVTKEHREALSKNAKALFIKCRDSVKDVQNKYIKAVKNKEKDGLAKDTSQQICDYIMYVASEYVSTAEKIMETKQQELVKDT